MRKLILKNRQSPGDIMMLTAAVRDLHRSQPGAFQTDVRTSAMALWQNNPYITPLQEGASDVEVIDCHYPLVHQSNQLPYHFIHGFRLYLQETLGVEIRPHAFKGDIYLSAKEKDQPSQVDEITGLQDRRFWIIVSGGKKDFTCKWWDPLRCQEIVNHFRGHVQFVQCGAVGDNHMHPPLDGVIDLVGKTDIRQMVRLMHHADGVLCPITLLMHLAAAVETRPGRSRNRPCVVIAGGREPSQWAAYPHHTFLHTNGCLPCCDNGGCWKSRVVPLGDGNDKDQRLCLLPVHLASGQVLPRCMDMITASDVILAMERYLAYDVSQGAHRPTHTDEGKTGMSNLHKVAQGECMASIAQKYKFIDYHEIYDHPKNAQLKNKRPNPNILAEGDAVFIPDKQDKKAGANTTQMNTYSLKGTGLKYKTIIRDGKGKPIANAAYVLTLPNQTMTGTTGGDGLLEKEIPLDAETGELTLTEMNITWKLHFGHLDPIDTITGVQARLNSLGYKINSVSGSLDDSTKTALSAFQKDNGLTVSGSIDSTTRSKLEEMHGC